MIAELLTRPCELVLRSFPETPDAGGEQAAVDTVVGGVLCEVQPAGTREEAGGAVQVALYNVFLPAGTPLRGWDAVRLTETGELLELEGDAAEVRSPLTALAHVELVARRTDYGQAAA